MAEFTAFDLSVIVSGTIFAGLMLWVWSKRGITLRKKGQITLLLLTGLAGVIYASFAFALISMDNASYYSEGRNLENMDYNQVMANARQAGYVVDGPNFIDSELHDAEGIWSPDVSQVRSYLGNNFWVRSMNYYFSDGVVMEMRFGNSTTQLTFYDETRQDTELEGSWTDQLPDDGTIRARLRAVFRISDTEAQTHVLRLKDGVGNESSYTAEITREPDFNSAYDDMKTISDRFAFTATTGTGLTRQVFYEDNRPVGSITYVVQNSRIIHRENGNDYIVRIDPRGGVNLEIRLSMVTEIPEEDYRNTFRKMFSDLGLDPAEVADFEFEYASLIW